MLITQEMRDEFYCYYESCWDYAHLNLNRGLLLQMYISECRPEFRYMFKLPKPIWFKDIPEQLQYGYKCYIMIQFIQQTGREILDEDTAIADSIDNLIRI